jgi:hypothetical protein
MMRRNILIPLGVIIVIGVIAVGVYFSYTSFDSTLEVTVRDAVSKSWVWDTSISVQNRIINTYYQSDRGPVPQTFTSLKTGESEITVSAPSCKTVTVPVNIKRGHNVVEEPIEIQGYEIPNLQRFIIFEDIVGADLEMELHPVGSDGKAVKYHPCVDLWIGCLVSEQLKDGEYVREPADEGSERGATLYRGKVEWSYDTEPETLFRYTAHLPGKQLKDSEAPYMVIDYVIIVPDSRKITKKEVNTLISEAMETTTVEELQPYLSKEDDRIDVYMFTSWNVERP